jgi:hypothetical protein
VNRFSIWTGFYQQSRAMMYNPEVDSIFRFTTAESVQYGNSGFGNSCLVARNLLRANQGTRYIQLNLGDGTTTPTSTPQMAESTHHQGSSTVALPVRSTT